MVPYLRPQDIVDIIIMTILVYQLYSWFRNTRALQVVMGLGFLGLLYVVTKNIGLFMTSWILQELGTVLFVLIIVVFQNEIRQALYRFSPLRAVFGRQEGGGRLDLLEVSSAVFSLAAARTGALIVFQRRERLDDFLLHGVPLDSLVSSQLLISLFEDGTPLHDGAVVIRDGRIAVASCHLPLSTNGDLPQYLGTRHRAAIGITERSDAAVVVVSEERGAVSLAVGGELVTVAKPEELVERLTLILGPAVSEEPVKTIRRRLTSNLGPKLATLLLVVVSWLIITGRQGGIVTVTVPIKYHNLPDSLALRSSSPEEVEVQLKVFTSLTPSPKNLDIVADLDLAKIREGNNELPVTSDNLQLPLGTVVASITPAKVKVVAQRKIRRELPIRLKKVPPVLRGMQIRLEPERVTVVGPEHLVSRLDAVETEEVDLRGVRENRIIEVKLVAPAPQVRILSDAPIYVRVTVGRR